MYRSAFICLGLILLSTAMYSQKTNLGHYNKLQQIDGTDYFIASFEDHSKKLMTVFTSYLLFINTTNGEKTPVEFGENTYVEKVDLVTLDSLSVKKVIVTVASAYEDRRFMDMRERHWHLFILSTDGKEKTKITDDDFYVGPWLVNSRNGAIIVTGFYDNNKNGKYDDDDKNDILIFDLKTLKKI